MSKSYVVNLFVDSSHEYIVKADSEEDAKAEARARYERADEGTLVWYEATDATAYEEGEEEGD